MYVIIGLGNPGSAYKWTRHNVGFETAGKLAFDHNIDLKGHKFRAIVGTGAISGQKVLLAMPQTYMNLSGESVRDILNYYDTPPERLIVIYDDAALEPGDIRVRLQGSAGGHNGMKNIIYQLETDEFLRVRIGIGQRPSGWDMADYVLSRFKEHERDDIIQGITLAAEAVETIISDGAETAMNKYNKKQEKK